jgi:prepilin-type N-terminal cleavage/methylation domain-containing protein
MSRRDRGNGFTLVELLVVIGIIAILIERAV